MKVEKRKPIIKIVRFYMVLSWMIMVAILQGCKTEWFEWPPPLNEDPIAVFATENQKNSLQVCFDASESYDQDGNIVSYYWVFGDGTTGEGKNTFHNYKEAGIYYVELVVRDDDDAVGKLLKEVDVYTSNVLPKAILTTNGTKENVDFVWQFDGSASYDSDGYVEKYKFIITRRSDEVVIKTFEGNQNLIVYVFNRNQLQGKQESQFKVELIVEDNRGEKGEACKVITILDPEN